MDHHLRATRRVRVFNSPPLLLLVHPARVKPTDNYNSSSSDNRTASRVSSERLLPEPANWTASTTRPMSGNGSQRVKSTLTTCSGSPTNSVRRFGSVAYAGSTVRRTATTADAHHKSPLVHPCGRGTAISTSSGVAGALPPITVVEGLEAVLEAVETGPRAPGWAIRRGGPRCGGAPRSRPGGLFGLMEASARRRAVGVERLTAAGLAGASEPVHREPPP